jgi:hypothetical protein
MSDDTQCGRDVPQTEVTGQQVRYRIANYLAKPSVIRAANL